jgi:HD superfamily phosphohydrolase
MVEPSFTGNPYGANAPMKTFTVRRTGTVYLYGPEIAVIDTPQFQRLRRIKQLGTSDFVFPGATHSRFEHSLGALAKAQQIIDAAKVKPDRDAPAAEIDETGWRVARLGALLHDLTHVPYGHTLEDEFGLMVRHDENDERIYRLLLNSPIKEILEAGLPKPSPAGLSELEILLEVLHAGPPRTPEEEEMGDEELQVSRLGPYAYVADIVGNTVCADALDYIDRDLSACGMPVAIGERFLDFFTITPADVPIPGNRRRMALRLDKHGMPRPDVESEILKLLTFRYELAERVFFHHAKNAASVMIGRAVSLLSVADDDRNFDTLGDDTLLAILAEPDLADTWNLKVTNDEGLCDQVRDIGRLLYERRLYKLRYLAVADDDVDVHAADIWARYGEAEERRRLEDELAAQAGLDSGDVLVHLPQPGMMAKLAKVRVLLADDTVTTFEEWDARHSGRVAALNDAHARLWRLGVFMHPEVAADRGKCRLVAGAARERFKLRSRYAPTETEEPYLAAVFDLHADEEKWDISDRQELIKETRKAAASAPTSLEAAVEQMRAVAQAARHTQRSRPRKADPQRGLLDEEENPID